MSKCCIVEVTEHGLFAGVLHGQVVMRSLPGPVLLFMTADAVIATDERVGRSSFLCYRNSNRKSRQLNQKEWCGNEAESGFHARTLVNLIGPAHRSNHTIVGFVHIYRQWPAVMACI